MSVFTDDFGDIRWAWVLVPVLVLFIAVFGWFWYYTHGTERTVTFTINKTERVVSKDSSKYLIFTKDAGVLEDTDSILRLKFNSSDIYNQLPPNQTYTCLVYGFRIPLLSNYPNIVKCWQ